MARNSVVAALSILVATVTINCGDPGYEMTYKNVTDLRLTVEIVGSNPGSPITREVEPRGRATSVWVYPAGSGDPRRTTVRAKDETGAELFCRKLSYDEAKSNLRWTVEILLGVRECD
ncbi:MAG: hypothetical protein ABR579_11780 [Actinomycetota bacterium]